MAVELKIPESGESISEVQIGAWLKSVGDYVRQDEIVAEIETDKASLELPAPVSGVITKLLKQTGELARVGDIICVIDETGTAPVASEAQETAHAAQSAPNGAARPAAATAAEPHVMPAARRALAERNLQPAEVAATGPGGRLLKEDVEQHVRLAAEPPATPAQAEPLTTEGREEEAVPMSMLRRRIAERLMAAQQSAALLTTFNECDMSGIVALRTQHQEEFQGKYGVRLGFMSFFVKAAIDALKLIPAVNAEIRALPGSDGRPVPHIVYKNYFDISVAVGTDRGLVVPVIRNAERLSFAEIERAVADLATRARDRRVTVEELQGGTFTISNGGVYGSLLSTPIVNPPQSAILGLHAIQERPVVRDGQVVIRPMMYLALTYDHRIIDGQESVTFLKRIKQCMENPARMLIEA
jgi:2-oxoglutarate dehydrogenase E2 component (dihydrolipoamide succinyltransferase)